MPNHVSHKITFPASYLHRVLSAIGDGESFDFAKLIPPPPQMYRGDLGSDDEVDFKSNWHSWNIENWGTKWNGYNFSYETDGEHAYIKFDTAWSVPYPVIVAFANALHMDFEHRYFDEGHNFWGIEKWVFELGAARRESKRYLEPVDSRPLCIELKGYDPESPDEVA